MASISGEPEEEAAGYRRDQLQVAKLAALAANHCGLDQEQVRRASFESRGLLVVEGRAFGLVDATESFGRLLHQVARLCTSDSARVSGLTIFAERDVAPTMARRAQLLQPALRDLDIDVLQVDGATAVPAVAAEMLIPPALGSDRWEQASVMADAGARVVDDHGRLVADVMGLEVARLTDDGLQVGVGEADRELQGYVNSHLADSENLSRAVETVRSLRPVPSHPLSRLARPRWLRSVLLDEPSLIGLSELESLPPLVTAETVFDREPAAAYCPPSAGEGGVTVVCSVGVDLNLIPEAFEYRERTDPDSHLLLVVPERDQALAVDPLRPIFVDPAVLDVRSIQAPWESVRS